MIQFEGALLTDDEQFRLASKLRRAAERFRQEYAALTHLAEVSPAGMKVLADDYGLPAAGLAVWLRACVDATIAAAEVEGATCSSVHWTRAERPWSTASSGTVRP